MIEFDAYEEEYGTQGNWHSDDHKEFLRVLQNHKGDYATTVLECSERMVGFDRLDILAHARWHSQYEELGVRKKLAIQAWRQQRQEEAKAQRERAEDAVEGRPGSRSCPKKCAAFTVSLATFRDWAFARWGTGFVILRYMAWAMQRMDGTGQIGACAKNEASIPRCATLGRQVQRRLDFGGRCE